MNAVRLHLLDYPVERVVSERWARSRALLLAGLTIGCQDEWMSGCWLVCGIVWVAWALACV